MANRVEGRLAGRFFKHGGPEGIEKPAPLPRQQHLFFRLEIVEKRSARNACRLVKQHLRIKRFYGNSINPVKTQVSIAVCAYVLVAILKNELPLPQSLHSILQVLSVSAFEK